MALASSGSISIGGTTSGRSINLELSRSATASSNLNETALRSLAQRTSGSISLSHFHGKSSVLETQTVTVGYFAGVTGYVPAFYGTGFSGIPIFYDETRNVGSCSDGTLNVRSNKYILNLCWQTGGALLLQLKNGGSTITNAGFTSVSVGGQTFSRSNATFIHNAAGGSQGSNNHTQWQWTGVSTNPFGTTIGATKSVVFS